MSKEKVWVISELFYPNEITTAYIMTEVACALSMKNDVVVITGPEDSSQNSLKRSFSNLKIERVFGLKNVKKKMILRAVNMGIVSFLLGMKLLFQSKKGDKVLTVTCPIPFILLASFICKVKRLELSILVHDIFPENAAASGILKQSSLVYRILKLLFDKAYANSKNLIVLGRDMRDILKDKISLNSSKTKIHIIENWFDIVPETYEFESKSIVLQYAGNIGRMQGLFSFVRNVELANNPCLKMDIYGGGVLEDELINYLDKNKYRVSYNGKYNRIDQAKVLRECDLCLVTLIEGMYGLGVPSKSYNIMAAGKAILFIGDSRSEVARLIKEYNIGFVFESNDEEGVVDFLNRIELKDRLTFREMGERARQLAIRRFEKNHILNRFVECI